MADRCGTCFFWRLDTCRRAPPIALQGGSPGWPTTRAEDWCGAGVDAETFVPFYEPLDSSPPAAPE